MYLTCVGSGPSSVLVVIQELLGFAFEFGKGPSGKNVVFRNHSVLAADVLCICFWAWKLETESSPVGRAWREVRLCSFFRINKAPRELSITDSLAGLFVLIQYYDFLPSPVKSIFTVFFLISSLPCQVMIFINF